MTREQLIHLLDAECYHDAVSRLHAGEDVVRVLNDQRPFVARYNDPYSRSALAIFQAIVAGETVIED